mmetsp:Transcript_26519/g.54782  ORF Transcript_26519/g.54782 Transcript_26519/m.54782 type:complete len:181 (+) Transcript_26519:99-641(+)
MARSSSSSLLFPAVLLGSFLYALCPREAFFLPSAWRSEPEAQEAAAPSSSRRSLLAGALAVAAPERANALTTEELRAANLFLTASPSVLSVSEGKKNVLIARAAGKESIDSVPQLEFEVDPQDEAERRAREDRWSGSTKGWLRILGIGVFFVAFVLIFILIIGGGYVPSWLKHVLKAIGF